MILSEKESLIKKVTLYLLFFLIWYLIILISVFLVVRATETLISPDFFLKEQVAILINSVKFTEVITGLGYFHIAVASFSAILALVTVDEGNE